MKRLRVLLHVLAETARLMVGQTPYHAYRKNMAIRHPGARAMDEGSFFRYQQELRYNRKQGGRCC